MKKIRSLGVAGILLSCVLSMIIPSGAVRVFAASDTPVDASSGELTMLLSGLEDALAGEFEQAQKKIASAAGVGGTSPELFDPVASLLAEYVELSTQWRQRRLDEYQLHVQRVNNALLANEHLEELVDQGLHEPIQEAMKEIREGFQSWPSGEQFSDGYPEDLGDLKASAREAAKSQLEQMDKLEAIFIDTPGPYAQTLKALAADVRKRIDANAQAWAQAKTADSDSRRLSAVLLRKAEEDLVDAIASLDAFTSDEPLRNGLPYARLAKIVSPHGDAVKQQDWYVELVSKVTQRAQEATQEGKWYEALASYNGLSELEEDNDFYRQQVKVTRRHARVLGLYGDLADSPQESPDVEEELDAPAGEMRWRDMVRGIDADMVHRIISQLDEQYVLAVDYRKLALGAIESLRVLASTPSASASFPALGDDAARESFLQALSREADNIQRKDRVDYADLTILLNTLLRASDRTVKIPVAVVAMEFTDGFLDELDRFSSMIWPADLEEFTKQTMGEFYGVGIQIGKEEDEPLKVITPLANSPALRAGIKTGDIILKVDGTPTEPLSVDKLVRMITGPKGTRVTLTVRSRGETQERDVMLMRDEIQIRTVKGWKLLPGGDGDNWDYMLDPSARIAYIRISQFTDTTPRDLVRALGKIKRNGVNSLILDLRFNPGGLLEASRRVADEFASNGKIVSTKGRQNRGREFVATRSGAYTEGDLVVLVNEMSASAAEIVSGAMRDWGRAIIVGQRTFGKGSVQNVLGIPGHPNARLKLTTAYYYLPSGRLLHRKDGEADWGVDPHVEVIMTPRERKHWLDIRRKTDLLQEVDLGELEKDLEEEYRADLPLNTAVLLLKLKQIQANSMAALANHPSKG